MVPRLTRILLAAPLIWAAASRGAEPATAGDGRYVIQSWDTDDGLPHSMVNAVVKRQDGFIWIATLAGIARFDGNSFLQVPSPLIQTDKSRSVHCLVEEDPETLLLACDNTGLLRLRDGHVTLHPATAQFPTGALRHRAVQREGGRLLDGLRRPPSSGAGTMARSTKFPPAGASFSAWQPSLARDSKGEFSSPGDGAWSGGAAKGWLR